MTFVGIVLLYTFCTVFLYLAFGIYICYMLHFVHFSIITKILDKLSFLNSPQNEIF